VSWRASIQFRYSSSGALMGIEPRQFVAGADDVERREVVVEM
jgi:hypothetical protein